MKINGQQELLAQIARRGLLLAALLGMVLTCTVGGRAQSNATSAPDQNAKPAAAPVAPVQSPAATAKPVSAVEKAAESREEKSSAKIAKEGIVVHGHWTIVVKNPDGTVAARQEFENTLDPIEGADLLTGLISGEYTSSGFIIVLGSSTTLCDQNWCYIIDGRNTTLDCNRTFLNSGPCPTLTYTPTSGTSNKNAVGFTLSGSATLPANISPTTTIISVSTGIESCLLTSSIVNGFGGTGGITDVANATSTTAFAKGLSGPAGGACSPGFSGFALEALALTSRTISQVVGPGQTVAVTVVITFSGS